MRLPAVGDTVCVLLVGRVTSVSGGLGVTLLGGASVSLSSAACGDDGFGWQPEPTPEPVYIAGQVYADAKGALFLRNDTTFPGDRWTVVRADDEQAGQRVDEARPARPLTRMIPEGGS